MEILSCVAYLLIGFLTSWVSNLLHFFYSQLSRSYNYPTETIGRKYLTFQLVFILNFFLLLLLMKGASWLLHKKRHQVWWRFFFTTPLLSLRSRDYQASDPWFLILKLTLLVIILFNFIFFVSPFLAPLNWWGIIALSPTVLFLTEAMSSIGELLALTWKNKIYPIHDNPIISKHLGDFWGRRWNRWVQDWLRDLGTLVRGRPLFIRLSFIFFCSGFFHEIMFNLPYWLVYKKSYFGTMLLYFLIQGVGLWVDKRFVYRAPSFVQRLYMWAVILLPSPIFLNTPLLTFLGIKND